MPTLPTLLLALLMNTGSATAADPGGIDQLAWLSGCWRSQSGEAGSGEYWTPVAGQSLLGISRTVKGGKTVEFEYMQIRAASDGKLAFFAQPSGQAAATFPLLRQAPNEAVFEDLAHDFPQRVIYRREGELLRARIEGTREGKLRGIDFALQRTSCDAPAG